jgi:hypothetical protein
MWIAYIFGQKLKTESPSGSRHDFGEQIKRVEKC